MTLPAFSPLQWTLAAVAALCIGLSKSGFPGVAMISVLLMAELMPARASTGAVLPLLICGDLLALGSFRRNVQWPYVWRILPVTLAGIWLGYRLLKLPLREGVFKLMIGGVILALAILQAIRMRKPALGRQLPPGGPGAIATGVACGVTTMVANAAGPVMAIYLIAMGLPQFDFVGTSAIFFLIVNFTKLPFSTRLGLITPHSLTLDLILAPAVAAGIFTGRALLSHIPRRVFEILVLSLAAASALKLMIDAF